MSATIEPRLDGMARAAQLRVLAPLSGQVWPLERVPDPVFAQKMVGDGLSIDPVDGRLLAACDAEVIFLHPAGHAVTLRTPEGTELLMHVGIDTVNLKGEGFRPRVSVGDQVRAGTPLIEFDLDFVATHAKSLLTQVVITNGDRVASWERARGFVSAGTDTLFTVTLNPERAHATGNGAQLVTSPAVLIPNPTGLHARPAAVLANLAKTFESTVHLQCDGRRANARSITAIMALEVSHGAKVQVVASGPDAAAAVERLAEVLAQGCGDEGCTPAPAPATTTVGPLSAPPPPRLRSGDPNLLLGVPASPGLAVGAVFQVRHPKLAPRVDGLSPAVLHLIAHTVRGARAADRHVRVGVCGGIASDRSAVPILLGIGVDELSVSLPAIPAVKAQIRDLESSACRALAERALAADSAEAVRALVPNPNDHAQL